MNTPSFSVAVPNYNHAKLLPRCLDSILHQSLKPQEIIVLDDCSTDNSVEVLEAFASKHAHIRLHRNKVNLGVVANINHALDLAQGEYFFSLGADDEILPGFFEKSISLLAQHPEAAFSCTIGDWREVHTGVRWHMGVGMTDTPAYISPQDVVRLEKQGRFFIPGHTAVYRRHALVKAGKFIAELRHYTDWFSTTVLALRHGVCVVPEPLAVFNIEPNTYFQRSRRNRQIDEAAIAHALKLLTSPDYSDVVGPFEQAGSLYICGWPTFRVAHRQKEFRRFITMRYLRKVSWHATRIWIKAHAPAFLLNLYVNLAGYKARKSSG